MEVTERTLTAGTKTGKSALADKMPLASVVVPAFNQERWLPRCLASLQAQSMGDFEVIVVDDGSTDGTAALVQTMAQQDPRFRLLQQPNAGAGAARNAGLQLARGQYLHFLDADDWLEPQAYAVWADAALRHPQAQVLFANHFEVDLVSGKRTRVDVQDLADGQLRSGLDEAGRRQLLTTAVMPWNRWIRRDYMLEHAVRFDEIPYANDRSCHYRLVKHLQQAVWCGSALINYQTCNPQSLAGHTGIRRVKSVLQAFANITQTCGTLTREEQTLVFAKNIEDLVGLYLQCPLDEVQDATQAMVDILANLAPEYDLAGYKEKTWYPVWLILAALVQGRRQLSGGVPSQQKLIPLAFAVNAAYLPFLNVVLQSASQTLDAGWQAMAFVFHLGLSGQKIEWLKRDFDFPNIQVCPVDLSSIVALDAAHTPAHYSAEIYLRLWIPELLRVFDKVLYLDADMVVRHSLHHLYAVDVTGVQLAGVRDFNNAQHKRYVEKQLGVDSGSYINSGVLLFNIKQCIREKFRESCFSVLSEEVRFNCPDQDMINTACAGRIKLMDSGWNYLWHYGFLDKRQPPDGHAWYKDDLANAQKKKYIIHYSSAFKPWLYPGLEDAELFWSVARTSSAYPQVMAAASRAKLNLIRKMLKSNSDFD